MRQDHAIVDNRRLTSLPLPHGCNVLSGKRCRLADGSMHPLVDSTSAARQKGVFATVTARKGKHAEEEAASVAGEDITDDEAASLVVDWDAHHRQVEVAWEPSSNRTDWVALLASKGHPPSLKCKLPPASQAMPSNTPLVVLRSPRPLLRIAWFFVLGFAPTKAYEEMLKSVVLSGRVHAPSLEPHFLYIMSKEQHSLYVSNGGPSKDALASWMLSLGVRVVGHVVSFAHKKGLNKEKAQGAQWARLDLFKMAAKMVPEFKQRGLMTSHVLYTDMDLFFSHDPPLPGTGALKACGKPWVPHDQQFDKASGRKVKAATWSKCLRPKEHGHTVADPNWPYIFGAGTEVFTPWGMNSGVMYINVPNSTKYAEPLIDFAAAKGFKSFSTADQQALEHFFGQNNFGGDGSTAWDWLDDSTVNSRGFLPPSEYLDHSKLNPVTKEPFSRAAVWHWHGYKANEIRCFFDRIASGAWDVTKGTDKGPAQDQVPGCHVVKGSGVFPHALKGCYLVTYAWMLTQHETLQQIARTMRVKQEGEW